LVQTGATVFFNKFLVMHTPQTPQDINWYAQRVTKYSADGAECFSGWHSSSSIAKSQTKLVSGVDGSKTCAPIFEYIYMHFLKHAGNQCGAKF